MSLDTLLADLNRAGVTLTAEGGGLRFHTASGPLPSELRGAIAAHRQELIEHLSRPGEPFEPFPLTSLQEAYWVGEQSFYHLSAPAHVHQEFTAPDLDIARLNAALAALMDRHDALRSRVLNDGTQRVMEDRPPVPLRIIDARDGSSGELPEEPGAGTGGEESLTEVRGSIGTWLPPLDRGPPFLCVTVRLSHETRVFLAFRLIGFDGKSVDVFFRDLRALYAGEPLVPAPGPGAYRAWILSSLLPSPKREQAKAHWLERLEELPPAPDLPRCGSQSGGGFRRLTGALSDIAWANFTALAARFGVTVNAALATIYIETIRRWSRTPDFTINVLFSARPHHGPAAEALGNFSSTLLLAVPAGDGLFHERAARTQARLHTDMAHAAMTGVEVIRELQRRNGAGGQPSMPVVFASFLGMQTRDDAVVSPLPGWRLIGGAMHTPQVLLDHQIFMDRGALAFNWDVAEDAFPPGMVEAMFEHYRRHLEALADGPAAWLNAQAFPLAKSQTDERQRANQTDSFLPIHQLHEPFFDRVRRDKSAPAVIDGVRVVTYGALCALTNQIAGQLAAAGVRRGNRVAVLLPRGWRQVAAVLGIHQAGAAYVPIQARTPNARVGHILGHAGVSAIIGDATLCRAGGVPDGVARLIVEEEDTTGSGTPEPDAARGAPSDVAYIIYTSGSTGEPKGVSITHRAAVNTIRDLIDRLGITAKDRVLAVSALTFDLSVFDIFGMLTAGGTVVMPPDTETPDPELWADLVRRHHVTVWNSVPALLEMTLDLLGDRAAEILSSLRMVMLSGDWIPVSLPGRLARVCPDASIHALGGATEAAIWSNIWHVEKALPDWPSIPYGYPLANQRYHVLDRRLDPAPVWVPGDLYIAGAGLAEGYHRDAELTRRSFFEHPVTGERLYRTGDKARYRPGGVLEFLGREDSQVKIGGFRIELGEIDAALALCPGVENAVTVVGRGADGRPGYLMGFAVPDSGAEVGVAALRAHLAGLLPDYMVPKVIHVVQSLPLTANGKVDRKRLESRPHDPAPAAIERQATATERALIEEWQGILGGVEPGLTDDFFAVGGTSLLAVRLINAIARRFGVRLPLACLFRSGTVAGLAERLDAVNDRAERGRSLIAISPSTAEEAPRLYLVHPVGGGVLCYRALTAALDGRVMVLGLQVPDNRQGQQVTVEAMAAHYLREVMEDAGDRPLLIGGWSMGGMLALEMAHQALRRGATVSGLFMIDSWCAANKPEPIAEQDILLGFLGDLVNGGPLPSNIRARLGDSDPEGLAAAVAGLHKAGLLAPGVTADTLAELADIYRNNYAALLRYRPPPLPDTAILFSADQTAKRFPGLIPPSQWLAERGAPQLSLPGNHYGILQPLVSGIVAKAILSRL